MEYRIYERAGKYDLFVIGRDGTMTEVCHGTLADTLAYIKLAEMGVEIVHARKTASSDDFND